MGSSINIHGSIGLKMSHQFKSTCYYPWAQLITVIINTIQLTLNWDGCALTNDKSINWHKGIIKIDYILTIKCSHSPTTTYQDTEVLTYSWPHSLVNQSKWIDRNLSSSMFQDWEPIARKLWEQTLKSRQYSIRCFSWSFNTSMYNHHDPESYILMIETNHTNS